jgi:hypothetical protein
LEVNSVDPRQSNVVHQYFSPSKEYIKILLAGNSSDGAKVAYAKIVIDEIIAQEDTTRVVQLSFADTAKYEWII